LAITYGVPCSVVLPAAAMAPLLVEHLTDTLDARISERVRIVETEASCRYVQRLAALHGSLVRAAASSDRYELHRAVEVGHRQMFDTAGLLRRNDTRLASGELIARERLMLQLAVQINQIVARSRNQAAWDRHDRVSGQQPLGARPHPPFAS
jgi:hypothetical protein